MSLPECLERAASELPLLADRIRPANGDPRRLLDLLAPSDAARVLAWVLANDQAAGEELLEAWAEMDGGAAVLVAVPEDEVPKAGRKGLRRALHRLRAGAGALGALVGRIVARHRPQYSTTWDSSGQARAGRCRRGCVPWMV